MLANKYIDVLLICNNNGNHMMLWTLSLARHTSAAPSLRRLQSAITYEARTTPSHQEGKKEIGLVILGTISYEYFSLQSIPSGYVIG